MLDAELNHFAYRKRRTKETLKSKISLDNNKKDETKDREQMYKAMTKQEQIKRLRELGLSLSEIRKLKHEKDRVEKLLELDK